MFCCVYAYRNPNILMVRNSCFILLFLDYRDKSVGKIKDDRKFSAYKTMMFSSTENVTTITTTTTTKLPYILDFFNITCDFCLGTVHSILSFKGI